MKQGRSICTNAGSLRSGTAAARYGRSASAGDLRALCDASQARQASPLPNDGGPAVSVVEANESKASGLIATRWASSVRKQLTFGQGIHSAVEPVEADASRCIDSSTIDLAGFDLRQGDFDGRYFNRERPI